MNLPARAVIIKGAGYFDPSLGKSVSLGSLGTHFTCFTGTKLQILTQKALLELLQMFGRRRRRPRLAEVNLN